MRPRPLPLVTAVTALVAAGLAPPAWAVSRPSGGAPAAFEFAVIGGRPVPPTAASSVPAALMADIAAGGVAFAVHRGGIGSGPAGCTDRHYQEIRDLFDASPVPVVYTPGEAEWAGCRGGRDPLERLGALRQTFFTKPPAAKRTLWRLERQPGYPENSRWRHGPVTFATVHVLGGRDGRDRDPGGDSEAAARQTAAVGWLSETFREARRQGSAGVALIWHGNPRFREGASPYDALRGALRAETLTFGRPVVLLHAGERFEVDRPMATGDGRPVEHFTRVKTPRSGEGEWVRVTVEPESRRLFAFHGEAAGAGRKPPSVPVGPPDRRCLPPGAAAVPIHPLPSGTGEVSGLVASSRYPGWGWMVRDSGHPPSLYAVRFPGSGRSRVVREIKVQGATNVDWEDIALHDRRLYVIESDQSRRARVIYEIPEPDPLGPARVKPSATYRYAYPGGRRYNTEAMFFFRDRLVLVPKTSPARLYRFEQPLSANRVNRPGPVGSLPGSRTPSVARVSPDGHSLVLANHQWLFVYDTPEPARTLRAFTTAPVRRQRINVGDNVEAGDFFLPGGCKLVLVAESRSVYRISARDLLPVFSAP